MTEDRNRRELIRKLNRAGLVYPVPRALRPEVVEAYLTVAIPKKSLEDGAEYAGLCRNANTAVWHAGKARFTYSRTKLGSTFDEDIRCLEDDNGFDVFLPMEKIKKDADHGKES